MIAQFWLQYYYHDDDNVKHLRCSVGETHGLQVRRQRFAHRLARSIGRVDAAP